MTLREEIRACARDVAVPAPGTISAEFCFPEGFTGFRGHFEGDPILPGICLMEAVVVLLENAGHNQTRLNRVRSAKFIAPIRPGALVQMQCNESKGGEGVLRIKASVAGGGARMASLDLEFSCDET